MPLTRAQIDVLRFAQKKGAVLLPNNHTGGMIRPHPQLPLKGAAAVTVIRALQRRGLITITGTITENGIGNLLKDPQASSDPQTAEVNPVQTSVPVEEPTDYDSAVY